MQVSCKVSYSVLVEIERQGAQLDPFFESFDTPVEYLKDPAGWLPIEKMEDFLVEMASYLKCKDGPSFYREVGQKNFELRAWGVLDSVLKMVESPKDIFAQPDRFLSYFLTPPPEFEMAKQEENKIIFSLTNKPTAGLVLSYMIGVVEGLPNYMGMPPAKIEPVGEAAFQITWYDDQQSLFDEQEKKRRQFHPEIVHSVMESIKGQGIQPSTNQPLKESPEQVASDAFEQMVSIEVEKRMGQWASQQQEIDETFFKIKNDFYKMYDYFTRAQQIITLVSPTARKASVREAMRRVDWDHIQKEFPNMVESACDSILSLKDAFHMSLEPELVPTGETKEPVNLDELIDNVVEELSLGEKSITVEKRLQMDKEVSVEPHSLAQALTDVFQNSVLQSSKGSELKITTRPVGSKVQIEIIDNSPGFSGDNLENIFDLNKENNLQSSQQTIERHNGNISISSRPGEGSTYLIELPL